MYEFEDWRLEDQFENESLKGRKAFLTHLAKMEKPPIEEYENYDAYDYRNANKYLMRMHAVASLFHEPLEYRKVLLFLKEKSKNDPDFDRLKNDIGITMPYENNLLRWAYETSQSQLKLVLQTLFVPVTENFFRFVDEIFESSAYRFENSELFLQIIFDHLDKFPSQFDKSHLARVLENNLKIHPVNDSRNEKTLQLLIRQYVPYSYWSTVRKAVENERKNPFDFIWESLCRTFGSNELKKLREIATTMGIRGSESMNRGQLCEALNSIKNRPLQMRSSDCQPDEVDPFTQEVIGDIPPYRRFRIGNQCYDLFALVESLKQNVKSNPFTREPLPVDEIMTQYNLIKPFMVERSMVFETIKNSPIMTWESILTQRLSNIWSKLNYPPPIQDFAKADVTTLNSLWKELTDYSVLPITNEENERYNQAADDQKFLTLIQTLERIVQIPQDKYTSTRLQAIEVALNNHIIVRRRRRSSAVEDENDENDRQRRRIGGKYLPRR